MLQIGADPELILVANGEELGVKEAQNTTGLSLTELDVDGNQFTGEIRPAASRTPDTLANRIERIMRPILQTATAEGLGVWAGGRPFTEPLGGHFHFSDDRYYDEIDYNTKLLLDLLVGYPLAEICPTAEARCSNTSYGETMDFRMSSPGDDHWEYRSPPSWLVSPAIVRAVCHLGWWALVLAGDGVRVLEDCDTPKRDNTLAVVNKMATKAIETARPVLDPFFAGEKISENVLAGWGYSLPEWGGAFGNPKDKTCMEIAGGVTVNRVVYIYGLRKDRGEEYWVSEAIDLKGLEDYDILTRNPKNIPSGILSIGLPCSVRTDVQRAVEVTGQIIGAAGQGNYTPKGKRPVNEPGEGADDDRTLCAWCEEPIDDGEEVSVSGRNYEETWCPSCAEDNAHWCVHCEEQLIADRCTHCTYCGQDEDEEMEDDE